MIYEQDDSDPLQDPVPAPQPIRQDPPTQDPERDRPAELFRRMQQRQEADLLTTFGVAVKTDPKIRADAMRIGQQLGVDPGTVERDPKVWREFDRQRAVRDMNLTKTSPRLAEAMRNIDFARLAHDDLDHLSTVERIAANWEAGGLEAEGGILQNKRRGGTATPGDLSRLDIIGGRLKELPPPDGFLSGSARILGQQATTLPEAVGAGVLGAGAGMAWGSLGGPTAPATVPAGALLGFGSGFLSAMAVQSYQIEAGSAYGEMVKPVSEGGRGYAHEAASNAAFGYGIGAAALEMVGLKYMAKGAGLLAPAVKKALAKEIGDALTTPTLGKAAIQFGKGWATGVGGEVATETMQRALEIAAEDIARRYSPGQLESTVTRGQVVGSLVDTALQTAQGMALLGLPGPGFALIRDAQRTRNSVADAKTFQKLVESAEGSTLRENSPEAFESVAGQMTKGTGAETAYVNVEQFAEILAQTGTTQERLAELLPDVAAQMSKVLPGGDVTIPSATFLAKLVKTPLGKALQEHVRFDPDGMSPHEAEAVATEQKAMTKEAGKVLTEKAASDKAFVDSASEVEESYRAEVQAVGRPVSEARANAVLYRDFVVVNAARQGVLPSEFHAARGLKFGPEPAQRAAEQVDQAGAGSLDAVMSEWKDAGIDGAASEKDGIITLSKIVVAEGERGKGSGTKAMQSLLVYADRTGQRVAGTPSADFGGDKGRLREFYKRLGFTENKGGKRNFATRETMIREPRDPNILRKSDGKVTRGGFDPATNAAFLTKEQNSSTALHELSHYFIRTLFSLAREPNAHPDTLRDTQAILDWFKVPDLAAWDALTIEQKRRHDEAFALNFEDWLHTGKAPSMALEGVFARIRVWLTQVYKSIRGELNDIYKAEFGTDLPFLTPEVRSVFDRLLANDEQIAHAEAVRNMAATFQTREQFEKARPGDDFDAYQKMVDEARSEALKSLDKASLGTMRWESRARGRVLKALQKEHDKERERVRAEVAEQVRQEPVHRARQWLKKGEIINPDGTTEQDKESNHKLHTATVETLFPITDPLKGMVRADGLNPDTVANQFGFETGEDLVRALVESPAFGDEIDARTDARMVAEHSELADPAQREIAVERALHNEARARFVATEFRFLAKSTQPVRLMLAGARLAARQALAGTAVRDVRPSLYSMAEARASREAEKAMKAGKDADALDATRRQLLQHALATEAIKARDEIDSAVEDFPRFFKPDAKIGKTRNIDLIYAGRALAAAYGLGPKPETGQQKAQIEAALQWVAENHPIVASRLASLLVTGENYKGIDLDDFRQVAEVADELWSTSRSSNVLDAEGRKVELQVAVDEFKAGIAGRPPRTPLASPKAGETPPPGRGPILDGWNVWASLKRMKHWARFMDGGKPDGPFQRHLVDPMMRQLVKYRDHKTRLMLAIHSRLTALAEASGEAWDTRIAAKELGFTFNGKKELIGAIMHAGTHSSLRKLLLGREGWGSMVEDPLTGEQELDTSNWDTFLARMFEEKRLTKADVEYVRFIWSTYAELLPLEQATHKALYGAEFKVLEHRPLVTPFGTLEGGYTAARTDRHEMKAKRPKTAIESMAGQEQDFLYSISTGKSFTLERNPNWNKPLILNLARQASGIDEQLRFLHLQPVVKDAMRIVKNREFAAAMGAYDREAVTAIIEPFLANAAQQASSRPSDHPGIDAVATFFRKAASLAYLGFAIGNSIVQAAGVSNARNYVKGGYLRSAVALWVRSPNEFFRVGREKSRAFVQRFDNTTRKIQEEIGRLGERPVLRGIKHVQQVAGNAAFFLQRTFQAFADATTWHGAYAQSIAEASEDLSEQEIETQAVAAADRAMELAQGSGNPEDKAAFEVTTPAMQLMQQFGSYGNLVLNQVVGQQSGRRIPAALWAILVPALFEATMKMALLGGQDDADDDGRIDDDIGLAYGKTVARSVTGLIPVAGPMLWSLAESDGARIVATPAAAIVQSLYRGAMAVGDLLEGDVDARDARDNGNDAKAVAMMLGTWFGLPLAPLGRAGGYALDVQSGKAEPSGPVDAVRGLLVGR